VTNILATIFLSLARSKFALVLTVYFLVHPAGVKRRLRRYFNPNGKTRKARRIVPLSERVIALLRTIQQEQSGQTEGWVFPSKRSKSGHIELSGLENRFREIARKLGIPDALKLYCARHTFGTVAMAETRDPGLVKEVMGHESLTTTMGYLHPDTAAIKAVIDRRNQQKINDGLAEGKSH
jgi:integrase